MKRSVLVSLAAIMLLFSGCYKDDINDLKDDVNKLKEQVAQYQSLLNALNNRLYIKGYETQGNFYVITLSDDTRLTIRNSSAFITIGENGNWIIDGTDTGQSAKGQSPSVAIGPNGNWYINGTDTDIPASGVPGESGKEAPGIISISLANDLMVFTFSDGETLQLQVNAPEVNITVPSGGFVFDKMQWVRISPDVTNVDGANFRWLLDEIEISDQKDLLHVFETPGTYQLTFSIKNDIGESSQSVTITINDAFGYTNKVRVYEYLPAPGQHINQLPEYAAGETLQDMAMKAEHMLNDGSMVSLGAYGGYIVMGFDHTIVNVPGENDFTVRGNGFPGSSEPGIVMVSYDANANGLPDDKWYEIAGSVHSQPATVKNYEITYHKPDPLNGKVRWTDNLGGEGSVDRNSINTQASYYPLWHHGEKLTFKGTRLPGNTRNTGTGTQEFWTLDAFEWGYADNQSNTSEKAQINIDWAVDENGVPIALKGINFIKVYTGVNQKTGLGEVSTDVTGFEDLHLK